MTDDNLQHQNVSDTLECMTTNSLPETWTVQKDGPRWNKETRTWDYSAEIIATGLSKYEAYAMHERLGIGHSCHPENQGGAK